MKKTRGPNGGARPGAGRKAGGQNAATISALEQKAIARETIRQLIAPNLAKIIEAQTDNSLGIQYLVLRQKDGSYTEATDKDSVMRALSEGGDAFRVYTRQPHQGSAAMLLGYAADKPIEPVEHTGPDGGAITVEVILQHARQRLAHAKRQSG